MIPFERLMEALSPENANKQPPARFCHGTTTALLEKIRSEGLQTPYLTHKPSLARYYALVAAEEVGGLPVVLWVSAEDELLTYDYHAVDEPVGFDNWTSNQLAERVQVMWDREANKHPEWVNGDTIRIPASEWKLSMETVASCRYDGILPFNNIQQIEIHSKE